MSSKLKRQPPERDFDKYIATFQSDPLKKSVGLKPVNDLIWQQFGPILSSSYGYVEHIQEPYTGYVPGGNTSIRKIGFDFTFDGVTYRDFIAGPHGWLALLDPTNVPTENTGTIYNNRFFVSGSSSFDNSAIKQAFTSDDLLLAPWFDRLMMTHRDLDSFVSFFSGSNAEIAGQKENFLFGKVSSKSQPYNERSYGMKYAVVDDSVDGKALVVRWCSMGYEYRGIKLTFEAALYQNGKIEFGYAPLDSYSTQYTLVSLSSDPVNVWKLDESAGTTVDDAVGNDDITYKAPGNMIPSAGKIQTSAFFSGSNSTVIHANVDSFANYSVTNTFSFSAWFKSAVGNSSNKPIVARMDTSFAKGYILYLEGGYLSVKISQTSSENTLSLRSSLDTYNDGQWHHAVVTYDGTASVSGVKVYVDGQVITMTTVESTLNTSSDIQASGIRFCIGANGNQSTTQFNFTGSIDDVAHWNAVITNSDVSRLYEQGLLSVSAADLVGVVTGDSTTSYATCGIFASGSSTWNYRDFAPLLGVMSASRKTSDFGGALYTGSYFDIDNETSVSASYAVNIGINHWPRHGGRITFSPPRLRRQLLRSDLLSDDNQQYFDRSGFDDRRIINYLTQSNVDASTILPLSSIVEPSYPGVHLKQNLISSGGIRLPNRKIISAGHASYMGDETHLFEKTAPFSEDSPAQGRLTDVFFLTGSISAFGENTNSFSRSIENKKQLKLTFNVDKKVKMFTSGSSLYYLNVASKQWNIPTRSLSDHVTSSFQKLSVSTTDAGGTCNGSLFLEDKIGFDSQGNSIISGNLHIFRSTTGNERNQSTAEIGTLFNLKDHAQILSPEYAKSIQRNSNYEASGDECFALPIDDPFLVEKAVVEIPFCMGDSWFNDKTTMTFISASNFSHTSSGGGKTQLPQLTFFDEGGPSITVSMFCQRNHGTGSVRDLVFKTTFSHIDDAEKTLSFTNLGVSGSSELVHVASLLGNSNSNQNIISDLVSYKVVGTKKQFTGSVLLKANCAISNCVNITSVKIFTSQNANTGSLLTQFDTFLNAEFIPVTNLTSPLERLNYLLNFDSFGRSMSGFSAGSGGEFITSKDVLFGDSVRNPFYTTGSQQRQTITGSLKAQLDALGTGSYFYCVSKVPLGSQKQAPYIIYPGDKFILAAAKTRPAINSPHIRLNDSSLSTGKITTLVSSSYFNDISDPEGHEVYLNTGSIKLTLYGSNVKSGGEVQ